MQSSPNDYLRVNIEHPSLDSPIWIEFTRSKNLTEEKILDKIEGVQQSKKEFILTDGATQIDFFHVQYPKGVVEIDSNTCISTRRNSKRRSNPLCRLLILGILCVYLVLLR
jgi:hypothetical protein